jgi:hypothetical protein
MAYEIIWQDVLDTAKDEATNLAAFTVPQQTMILDETYCAVPETYGDWTLIYAAHIAVQSTLESAGEGARTSESIGGVSSNKNQPVNNPSAKESLLETTYGRQYWTYLETFKKRFTIGYGLYSNGRLTGFPIITPSC